MNTLNRWILALLALLGAGCAGSLGESWTNFRARYNTYYNASQSFEAGLRSLDRGEFHLESGDLVRIHPSVHRPGQPDFEKAITKSEILLSKFPESRWADDALFLMARSHYHLDQLFQALGRFEQMGRGNPDPKLRQEAILWRSRVLFDLDRHEDAIAYLEGEIPNLLATQERNFRAEAKAQLAEHHIRTGNWDRARELLGEASSELHEGEVRSRTLFLFGQVLERMGARLEAFYAFANVSQGHPEHEYVLWSRIKQAQMSREMGNLEESMRILTALRRDDKNYSHIDLIRLETGRTREAAGETAEAEELYREVLQSGRTTARPEVRSRAYYQLGLLHVNRYGNFGVAAAYFDSAEAAAPASPLFAGAGAGDRAAGIAGERVLQTSLAATYRNYARLKERNRHLDSLLWLGALPQERRDSIVAVVRERKLAELKQARNRESEILYTEPGAAGDRGDGTESSAPLFGFLNYRNPDLAEQSRRRFRAYWGDRSLSDHWRRREMVPESAAPVAETPDRMPVAAPAEQLRAELQLDEIPVTPPQRDSLREEQARLKLELGNLFFLELDRPDSARHYYRELEREHAASPLVPRALYSLSELYREEGMRDSAEAVTRRMRERYGTLAAGLSEGGRRTGETARAEGDAVIRSLMADSSLTRRERAEALAGLAAGQPGLPESPARYFRAIELFVEEAKAPAGGAEADADAASAERYRGAAWDRVRSRLGRFLELFPDTPLRSRAEALLSELDRVPAGRRYRCEEQNAPLTIRGGVDSFLEKVRFPENLAGMSLEGEITYNFLVDAGGEVEEYRLASPDTGLGLEEALESAFGGHLRFNPLTVDGRAVPAECRFTFPVNL